jgi:hypothetical protein
MKLILHRSLDSLRPALNLEWFQLMPKVPYRFAAVFILVLTVAMPIFALQAREKPPALEVLDKLCQGPEHQDIPWKVHVSSPRLMYQQTYLVQARARIDPLLLKRVNNARILHFALKVQAADGRWATGGEFKDYTVPPDIGRDTDLEYETAVYLRPGNYTLIVAVLDSGTGQSSLLRQTLRIPPMPDDPFPELDSRLAAVEFPDGFPQQEVGNDEADDGELFPVSRDRGPIPVATPHPTVVDIVLDITKRPTVVAPIYFDLYGRPRVRRRPASPPAIPPYDLEVGRLLQVGNLLARLAPQAGCVRVSAVDVLRMKTMLDKVSAKTIDWPRFEQQIQRMDQDTVDVAVLTNKKGPAEFMRRYLDELSADSPACASGGEHYVVVVSHEVPFPEKDGKLADVDRERARFYYLVSQVGGGMGDDLNGLLKPVKPQRLSFNSPRDFRKALAKIVADLKSGK